MDWPENVGTLASIVLTFALLGFGTWLTAFLSFRSKVRQQVWQQVFDAKWQTIRNFDAALLRFTDLVQVLHNIALARERPTSQDKFVVSWGLFSHYMEGKNPAPGSTAAHVLMSFPAPEEIGKNPTADVKLLEQIFVGFRNIVIQDLWRAYAALKNDFVALILVGYDPNVPKRMEMLAMDSMNQLSGTTRAETKFDFAVFFESWKIHGRYTRLRLREDLVESSKSLSRALRMSPRWKRHVEEQYKEKFPNLR